MNEIAHGILHGGHPFFGHPEAMFFAVIIAGVVFGVGAAVAFLLRKFFFPVKKKWG